MNSAAEIPAPGPVDLESRGVTRAALLLDDYRGIVPEPLRAVGESVRAGDALLRDRRRPEIRLVAPAGGRISRIERAARRKLVSVQIEIDATAGTVSFEPPADGDAAKLRGFMLETGAWSSLRTRPFGNIPRPDGEPAAIFVSALDTEPLAPDPQPLIDACMDAFRTGSGALAAISEAPVYVCHAADHALQLDLGDRVRCVAFRGGYEAGHPATHIHALSPIGFGGGEVWQLGYQDVIALGWLLQTGAPWTERVISLGGDALRRPRTLRTAAGAAIGDLLQGELHAGPVRILCGSAWSGREITDIDAFVGARQRQITVLRGVAEPLAANGGVLIPNEVLEQLAPPGIYPVPLLRSLQIGDVERARDLGALELLEEDLAPLSRACLSRSDYGALLRGVLDQLEEGRR